MSVRKLLHSNKSRNEFLVLLYIVDNNPHKLALIISSLVVESKRKSSLILSIKLENLDFYYSEISLEK